MTTKAEERTGGAAVPRASVEQDEVRRAKARAEALQGLYIHLLVYLVINAGLFVVNLLTRGDDGGWWFLWPLAIWGVALLIHVVATYVPVFSPDWAERRAARMLEERRAR